MKIGFTKADDSSIFATFRLKNFILLTNEDYTSQFQELHTLLVNRVEDFNERGSGNVLAHIAECAVQLANYNPTGVNFILNVL